MKKPENVGEVRCGECRKPFDWPHEGWNRPLAICPFCGALTKVGERPRFDRGMLKAFGDSDNWSPWLPNCGEFNIDEREKRKKEGSIRWNPKTKAWSGYFETQKQYNDWMDQKGVANPWRGEINQEKQRWYRSSEEADREFHERYRERG